MSSHSGPDASPSSSNPDELSSEELYEKLYSSRFNSADEVIAFLQSIGIDGGSLESYNHSPAAIGLSLNGVTLAYYSQGANSWALESKRILKVLGREISTPPPSPEKSEPAMEPKPKENPLSFLSDEEKAYLNTQLELVNAAVRKLVQIFDRMLRDRPRDVSIFLDGHGLITGERRVVGQEQGVIVEPPKGVFACTDASEWMVRTVATLGVHGRRTRLTTFISKEEVQPLLNEHFVGLDMDFLRSVDQRLATGGR